MKHKLPSTYPPKTALTVLRARLKTYQFPSFLRFFTELPALSKVVVGKVFIASFLSGFLLVAIGIQSMSIWQQIAALQAAKQNRQHIVQEMTYWRKIVNQHTDYRDGYFHLAALAYRLGDVQSSRDYLNKVFALDPNYKQGKVLAEKIATKF